MRRTPGPTGNWGIPLLNQTLQATPDCVPGSAALRTFSNSVIAESNRVSKIPIIVGSLLLAV